MSSRRSLARRDRDGGFTLVETLVALVVLTTISAVLFRGVVGMRAGAAAFDDRTQATLIARSLLDEAITDRALADGRRAGLREGRRWAVVVTPVDLAQQLPAPPPDVSAQQALKPNPQAVRWVPQRIVVTVATGGRPVEIETLRLVKAPIR